MPLPKKKSDDKKRPIIIKKVIRPAAPHHGGMWKVAYADFVTAMMAFFLLLWLISTSSKETLQGLSEYFTPTMGIKDTRPIGINNASPTPLDQSEPGINLSTPGPMQNQAGSTSANPDRPSPEQADEGEDNLFEKGADAISQALSQDAALNQYQDNIQIGQTPEGLRIDIADSDKYAMFQRGTSMLTTHGQTVLARLIPLLKRMPNYMSIAGYTDGSLVEEGEYRMQGWELSTERAKSALKYMVQSGIEPERPQKILGLANTALLDPNEPRSAKNRRITLVMLRGSHILIPDSAVPMGAKPIVTPSGVIQTETNPASSGSSAPAQ